MINSSVHRMAEGVKNVYCLHLGVTYMMCMRKRGYKLSSLLCPSPTVPKLLPNEHESTIRVGSGVHSWSFQSIPIHSSSVLLMHVGSAVEYESFEHVQKLCVASTNEFHSCLCVLRTCSYRVVISVRAVF